MTTPQILTALLGIRYPLIQAPMAGVSTPALAAAVSDAGGLGSLGLGAVGVQAAAEQIRATRALTRRPFNANFFCHAPAQPDPEREARWLAHLAPEFARFGSAPPPGLREPYGTGLHHRALLAMLLQERPAVVSFHFGIPDAEWISALREAGIVTLACVTDLDEARQGQQAGIDVLVAQGVEAGGHRGTFHPYRDRQLTTLALVRLLAREVDRPLVAAGGIMDGAGLTAALALGAAGVQMGTAFLLCPESATSAGYRAALQSDRAHHTAVTAAISGRPARGLRNRAYDLPWLPGAPALPDYPIAYDAGKALHQIAAQHGCEDYAAYWAGQGAPLARPLPAADLVARTVEEWRQAANSGLNTT